MPNPGIVKNKLNYSNKELHNSHLNKILISEMIIAALKQPAFYKNSVTGKLTFDNYEKDGSRGAVHGTIEGNIMALVQFCTGRYE